MSKAVSLDSLSFPPWLNIVWIFRARFILIWVISGPGFISMRESGARGNIKCGWRFESYLELDEESLFRRRLISDDLSPMFASHTISAWSDAWLRGSGYNSILERRVEGREESQWRTAQGTRPPLGEVGALNNTLMFDEESISVATREMAEELVEPERVPGLAHTLALSVAIHEIGHSNMPFGHLSTAVLPKSAVITAIERRDRVIIAASLAAGDPVRAIETTDDSIQAHIANVPFHECAGIALAQLPFIDSQLPSLLSQRLKDSLILGFNSVPTYRLAWKLGLSLHEKFGSNSAAALQKLMDTVVVDTEGKYTYGSRGELYNLIALLKGENGELDFGRRSGEFRIWSRRTYNDMLSEKADLPFGPKPDRETMNYAHNRALQYSPFTLASHTLVRSITIGGSATLEKYYLPEWVSKVVDSDAARLEITALNAGNDLVTTVLRHLVSDQTDQFYDFLGDLVDKGKSIDDFEEALPDKYNLTNLIERSEMLEEFQSTRFKYVNLSRDIVNYYRDHAGKIEQWRAEGRPWTLYF